MAMLPVVGPLAASDAPGLPDPLLSLDGTRIVTARQWEETRRPEILELFRRHVYGRAPVERPDGMTFEIAQNGVALDDHAKKRKVRIGYEGPGGKGRIAVTLYVPRTRAAGVFLLIVNRSRRIIDSAGDAPSEYWPVRQIIGRGYAAAAFHVSDVDPDEDDGFQDGVQGIFDSRSKPRPADAWGTVAAWAWGASRVIDYLETDPDLRGVPIAVIGHSRGGKAALWCGAQDRRVALTISNESGNTGAALSRGATGETIAMINKNFPHWFAKSYRQYGGNENSLPLDQHMLIALIAPRLVYVASAADDAHASPEAEFRSCVEAAPVFSLYGLRAIEAGKKPGPGDALHEGAVGYHLRRGSHNLTGIDWTFFLDYADCHWPAQNGRPAAGHQAPLGSQR